MKTRVISIVLVLLMIFGLIAACSEVDDKAQIPESTAVATTPEPTPEPPTLEPTLAPEPRNPEWTDDFNPVTGWDMMERLGAGITVQPNMSEQHWDIDERVEQWHIETIAQKGFKSITIEPSWYYYMDANADIELLWFDRVQQVVDWALEAGLNVVLGTSGEHELNRYVTEVVINGSDYEDAKYWFCKMWEQIAERFKYYPEKLVFRLRQEPTLRELTDQGWTGEFFTYNGVLSLELCDVVDRLNADMLNVIRNSGGNNDKRVVVLATAGSEADTLPYINPPDDDYIMYGIFHQFWWLQPGSDDRKQYLSCIEDALNDGVPLMFIELAMYSYETVETLKTAFSDNKHLGIPTFFGNFCPNIFGEPRFYDPGFDEEVYMKHLLHMTTGEWDNEDVLNEFLSIYGIEPGLCEVVIPIPDFPYEWVASNLQGPENQFFLFPPMSVKRYATRMVVELSGDIRGYEFAQIKESPLYPWTLESLHYVSYNAGSKRVTETDRKIVFNLRGLAPYPICFRVLDNRDAHKVERIYIDNSTMQSTYTEPLLDGLVRDEEGKLYSMAFWLKNTDNWDGHQYGIFTDGIILGETTHISYTINSYSPASQTNQIMLGFSNGQIGYTAFEFTISNATLTKNGETVADVNYLNRTQTIGQDTDDGWVVGIGLDEELILPNTDELTDVVLSMDVLIHEVWVSVP